jgi:hypothetical protein
MVITAAQPVFNRSAEAVRSPDELSRLAIKKNCNGMQFGQGSKGSLIGVVGVDIPTEDFIRVMSPHKVGQRRELCQGPPRGTTGKINCFANDRWDFAVGSGLVRLLHQP